jgi:uncharacterized protein (DUF1697 family)
MKRYIALLRGVNISGKNKVPMAELKKGFEELGFAEVRTYLNSGNVIFSSDEGGIEGFTNQIETMIKRQFGVDIPVFVISKEALGDILVELEKIKGYKETVFWSFSRKDYQKTNWWPKTASANISAKLTIRTANTVRKIVEM